jgi:tellurite resistance protein
MVDRQQQEAFIRRAARGARRGFKEFGVPASVTIAQAILESAWGTSHLGSANNYFGIKAQRSGGRVTFGSIAIGFVESRTNESVSGNTVTVTAVFRKYASMADSFRDHGKFLRENSRYKPCFEFKHRPNEFARALQRAGYATDPHYADSLIRLMSDHDLYRFDRGIHKAEPKPEPGVDQKPKPDKKPKPGPKRSAAEKRARLFVAGLQRDLNEYLMRFGASRRLAVDGIWDKHTEQAFEQVCRVLGIEPERSVRTFRVIAGAAATRSDAELDRAAGEGAKFAEQLMTQFAGMRGVGAVRVGGKDLPQKQRSAAFVAALQRDLNSHLRGLGSPRVLAVDGVWDEHTKRALEQVAGILGIAPTRDARTYRLIAGAAAAPLTPDERKNAAKGAELARRLEERFAAERKAGGVVVGGRTLPGKMLAKAYIAGLQRDLNTQLKWLGATRMLAVDGIWDAGTERAFERICKVLGVEPKRNARTFRIIAGATAERSDEERRRGDTDGAAFEQQLRSFFAVEPAVLITQTGKGSGNGAKPEQARPFRVRKPEMKGEDVAAFQRLINRRFKAWDVTKRIDVDGEYGPETRTAAREVAFGLGIAEADYSQGITPALRHKLRDPRLRTPAERARAQRRRGWLRAFKHRHDGGGAELALEFARRHVGTRESSRNRGPRIDEWNKAAGSPIGSEWCGTFLNACLMAAGFPRQTFLPRVRDIETHARAGTGGWRWTMSPRPGDLVLYVVGDAVNHAGIVESVSPDGLVTIEGNTHADGEGAGAAADEVERRHRRRSEPRGFARPPYAH